jgi:hypothetical protein
MEHIVGMKMTVFWDAALCSLVEVYWCFRGACAAFIIRVISKLCKDPHVLFTKLHGAATQKKAAVRT